MPYCDGRMALFIIHDRRQPLHTILTRSCEIAERPSCRLVVNTTGLQGGEDTHPVRGQLVLVKAPYVQMAMGEYNPLNHSYPTYIYPRRDHVVLGSTYLEDVGDKEVNDETTKDIIERCAEFIPELRNAPILAEVVCIRPGRRSGVRLDRAKIGEFDVVNCFGHGGAGHSLSWGCAGNVVTLVRESIRNKSHHNNQDARFDT